MKKIMIFTLLVIVLTACNQPYSSTPVAPTAIPAVVEPTATPIIVIQTVVVEPTQAPSTATPAPTVVAQEPTLVPTFTFIPAVDATSVVVPVYSMAELESECWSESPDTFKFYLDSKTTVTEDELHSISYADLKAYADIFDGYWHVEVRLPGVDMDRTDIFDINVNQPGNFEYVEGSFWFTKNECAGRQGHMFTLYHTGKGKWDGREEQKLLTGFLLVIHDPADYGKVWAFDTSNPFRAFDTVESSFGPKSCEHLEQPLRQEFYGAIDGQLHNFSFGAINCQSFTIGNFPDGRLSIRLFDNAQDNILVTFDADLAHFIFPADWSGNMISDWLQTNYPGIEILDPEGVLE